MNVRYRVELSQGERDELKACEWLSESAHRWRSHMEARDHSVGIN